MQKLSVKYLISFSISIAFAAGVAWACADGETDDPSVFAPEYFVDKQYSPFFFYTYRRFYNKYGELDSDSSTLYDNNMRFNEETIKDWQSFLGKINFPDTVLRSLLFTFKSSAVDSIDKLRLGILKSLPAKYPNLSVSRYRKKNIDQFFSYLKLAKEAELYAVDEENYWYEDPPKKKVSADIETKLKAALNGVKEPFLKQRYWFQLVRYYFYKSRSESGSAQPIEEAFNSYANTSPKNNLYFRNLGYLAGYYYGRKNYAKANYLYSLCYDYSYKHKIPAAWSFKPQQETDWLQTLKLAKSKEEQITLWHLLGTEHDPARALKEIVALNPKSEKADLLLSRLINIAEEEKYDQYYEGEFRKKGSENRDLAIVDEITRKAVTAKPWFWNMASGYLHYLNKDYQLAGTFYRTAEKQIPENDLYVLAQYKILKTLLFIAQLKKIDIKTEAELVETLNWLADLRDRKKKIDYLRFEHALHPVTSSIANLYQKQNDLVKAVCLENYTDFYTNNQNINKLISLFLKADKTDFEKAVLRYYPFKVEDLYYHQACMFTYQEKIDEAIEVMEKSGNNATDTLPGNPFNSRLNDCHDCDHENGSYTPLSFLKGIKQAKTELSGGKNQFRNAWLLANAYYNIKHYGNARLFYQTEITTYSEYSPNAIPEQFRSFFTSQDIALKYYLQARNFAQTNEQLARATFMASKCERNEFYNDIYRKLAKTDEYGYNSYLFPGGKYFAELKEKFSATKYYQEVIKECGYFREYLKK